MSGRLLPVFIVILVLLGVLLLCSPRTIQRIAVRSLDREPTTRMKGLRTFIGSNAYLWNVRIVGLLSLVMGFLLLALRAGGDANG